MTGRSLLVALAVSLALPACGSTNDPGQPAAGSGGAGASSSTGSGAGTTTGTSTSSSGSTGSSSGTSSGSGGTSAFGPSYSGQYNLGPVDWAETQFHNACAPYPASVQQQEGALLAGLNTQHIDGGRLCDACVFIKTAKGKQVLARVVTYGDTGPNDIDLSPSAYAALDSGEYPRDMTWQLAKCDGTGNLEYQFQTGANIWWTSFWVRNERMPLAKVEVQSANHASFTALTWGGDGTLTDGGGFGDGAFTLRVTSSDGQQVTDMFPSFTPGGLLQSTGQFQ